MQLKKSIAFIIVLLAVPLFATVPADLIGSWRLTQVTCDGVDSVTVPQSSLNNGTISSYISIVSWGLGNRYWFSSSPSSCAMSVPMTSMSGGSGSVTFTDATSFCFPSPSSCFTGCGVSGNTNTFSYNVSGGVLTLTVANHSPYGNPCAGQSGPIVMTYEKI